MSKKLLSGATVSNLTAGRIVFVTTNGELTDASTLTFNSGTGQITATSFSGNLNASNLNSGTVDTARLGSGSADNTKFLRGDQTWATPTATAAPGGSDTQIQ